MALRAGKHSCYVHLTGEETEAQEHKGPLMLVCSAAEPEGLLCHRPISLTNCLLPQGLGTCHSSVLVTVTKLAPS